MVPDLPTAPSFPGQAVGQPRSADDGTFTFAPVLITNWDKRIDGINDRIAA
jgi:hypothetical protein